MTDAPAAIAMETIPAGTEPVEAWFATTATALVEAQNNSMSSSGWSWWERGGWDHTERHDDRVNVFATRLGEGEHVFTYLVRATTAGTFIAAPTFVEEMYEPEVFGRTATTVVRLHPPSCRPIVSPAADPPLPSATTTSSGGVHPAAANASISSSPADTYPSTPSGEVAPGSTA